MVPSHRVPVMLRSADGGRTWLQEGVNEAGTRYRDASSGKAFDVLRPVESGPVTLAAGWENVVHIYGQGAGASHVAQTPAGQDVMTTFLDGTLTLTFGNVTTEGDTTVTVSPEGSVPPTGFEVYGQYFNVESTAEVDGSVEICFNYSDIDLTPEEEEALQLLHYETDDWYDITTSLETEFKTICGSVTNFSEFLLVYPVGLGPEGETLTEGEPPAEGEGESGTEGETPTEGEGETAAEGETPVEGEGETTPEGETPAEGEGETTPEGETPAEGEDCGGICGKKSAKDWREDMGDWFWLGAGLVVLLASRKGMASRRKR